MDLSPKLVFGQDLIRNEHSRFLWDWWRKNENLSEVNPWTEQDSERLFWVSLGFMVKNQGPICHWSVDRKGFETIILGSFGIRGEKSGTYPRLICGQDRIGNDYSVLLQDSW